MEAEALAAAGVDVIVASGTEAGGHRASFLRPSAESLGVSALVPQIVDRVRTPVVAAGGIAEGRGAVAAFALGARRSGRHRFSPHESGATPAHKRALVEQRNAAQCCRGFSGIHAASSTVTSARCCHRPGASAYP